MRFFAKKLWLITSIVFGVLAVVMAVLLGVGTYHEDIINVYLEAPTQQIIPEEGAKIYYWTEYATEEELVEYGKQVCYDIESEGATLLKNDNDALPLPEGAKVSCFSQSSVDPIYAGTGSASVAGVEVVSLNTALTSALGEGSTNTELVKFYTTSGYKRVNAALSGGSSADYRINEVPWNKYTDPLKSTFSSYGDAAIVMLSRSGGEGSDLPSGIPSLSEYMTDGDYLRLCKEETDMLSGLRQMKKDGVFDRIIVLINTANILQLDFLDEYDVDAALWIGNVGATGMQAVADILSGDVVPSGRIVDTFLKDNHSSPAMANFGAYDYTNADELGLETAQNNTDAGVVKANRNYVVYQEGIYVGYRYYETRYEDYVLGRPGVGDYDYDADVAYPFGYGESYVDFTYSDFDVRENEKDFTVTVNVKNEGDRAAKHTVQIYFQSEYTEYDVENDVEKSAVEICGFDKKEIGAGATETYTITVDKEDLTSYDHKTAKTYILEDGDYYFTAGRNAHDAVNNILMAKQRDGVTVHTDRMSGTGNADLAKKWTNDTLDAETYSVSSATGNDITNLFDDADLNKYAGAGGQTVTYLTRNDWEGTFPTGAVTLRVTDEMWNDGLTHEESGRAALAERYKQAYGKTEMPDIGTSGSLALADLCEADMSDPRWNTLISQMSYDEMIDLICNGAYATQTVTSIGMPGTRASDGPYGFTKALSGGGRGMCYPSESVLAATFDTDLARSEGNGIAEDLMHASMGDSSTIYAAMYAPGANIHRTPYSGRNGEYYSEDGWLSGEMCSAEAAGMRGKGIIAVAKHYALNDQENGRYGISTWSNEQAIREVYLEGFETFAVEGGTAIMSSFNRIGVVWAGAHHGLMTGVLRDEWGMKGMAVTDMASSAKYMDYRAGLLAGQDIWLGYESGMISMDAYADDAAIVNACHEASKRVAYTVSRSHAMNVGRAQIIIIMPWWKVLIIALLSVFAAIAVILAALYVVGRIVSRGPRSERTEQ